MRTVRAAAASLLLAGSSWAGCASAPEEPSGDPEPALPAELPEALAGVPPSVIAGRALFDLESGDPDRQARARCVLLALPEGPGAEALRERARSAPAGSAARLASLAVLAERGDPLEGVGAPEVVAMSLREIARQEPSSRGVLLALVRLREMGEAALPALREEAKPGGAFTEAASRVLLLLAGDAPAQGLHRGRP